MKNKLSMSLFKIVEVLYKMGLLRVVILVAFGLWLAFASYVYGNLIENLSGVKNAIVFTFSDSIYLIIFLLLIVVLLFMLRGIYQIDKHFEAKSDKEHKEIINRLDNISQVLIELVKEIRNDRKGSKNHNE